MRRRDFSSDAEYYRAHRKVFLFALERGITPAQAEIEMRRIELRERRRARERSRTIPATTPSPRPTWKAWDAPHMMRN